MIVELGELGLVIVGTLGPETGLHEYDTMLPFVVVPEPFKVTGFTKTGNCIVCELPAFAIGGSGFFVSFTHPARRKRADTTVQIKFNFCFIK